MTLLPQESKIRPRSKANSTTRLQSVSAGTLVLRSLTNSTPIIRPMPRTSPMEGWRAMISCKASCVYWPTTAAFSRYSFSIKSMVARAAAQESGLPPKVLPCAPRGQSITDLRATQAPRGIPEAMPLAIVMISGSTSKCSIAHHLPVRPMPHCTSSAMKQDFVFVAQFTQGRKEARRWNNISAFALNGLHQDASHLVRREDVAEDF